MAKDDVIIKFGGDISGLNRALDQSEKKLKKWRGASLKGVGEAATKFTAFGTGAALAAAAGITAITKASADSAREIINLSKAAATSTTDFQKWAFASKTVGIEQDKLADILKDFNDRVGDFSTTGAGPMVDFFEQIAPKVGVTIDQFKKLSGAQGIQLFFNSLEKANLSQSEMTFHLEAISSDLTNMQPLLAENGKAIKALGDEYETIGGIFSETDLAKLDVAKSAFDRLAEAGKAAFASLGVAASEEISAIADIISDKIGDPSVNWDKVVDKIANGVVEAVATIADFIQKITKLIKKLDGALANFAGYERIFPEEANPNLTKLENRLDGLKSRLNELSQFRMNFSFGALPSPTSDEIENRIEQRNLVKEEIAEVERLIALEQQEASWGDAIRENLKAKLQIVKDTVAAKKEEIELQNTNADTGVSQSSTNEDAAASREVALQEQLKAIKEKYRVDDFTRRVETQALILEQEKIFNEEMVLLDSQFRAGAFEKNAQWHVIREETEKQHMERLKEIKRSGLSSIQKVEQVFLSGSYQSTLNAVKQFNGAMEVQNKKDFERKKKLSIATSLASLPSAVIQSFQRGGGYPWGLIPAGLMAATGLMQINNIRKTKYNSGGSASTNVAASGGGAASASTGTPVSGESNSPAGILQVEGFNADQLYTGDRLTGIAEQLNEHARNGGQTIFI